MLTLTKIVQTSVACPSQWDAWASDGTYVYLRYRHGYGTVQTDCRLNIDDYENELVTDFTTGDDGGYLDLHDFLTRVASKVQLAPDAEIKNYGQHLADELDAP